MSSNEETPIVPAANESSELENKAENTPEPAIDPKEEARRRSKEDLARKRRTLRNSHGKR